MSRIATRERRRRHLSHLGALTLAVVALALFTLGLGFVVIVDTASLSDTQATLSDTAWGTARDARSAQVLAGRVAALEARQNANRAANVSAWCHAIDQQGAALSAYVAAFHRADPRIPLLGLSVLDCPALEQATLASSRP